MLENPTPAARHSRRPLLARGVRRRLYILLRRRPFHLRSPRGARVNLYRQMAPKTNANLARAQPRDVNSPRDVSFSPRQRRGASSRESPSFAGAGRSDARGDARGRGCTSPFSMESAVDERHQFWIAAGDIYGGTVG